MERFSTLLRLFSWFQHSQFPQHAILYAERLFVDVPVNPLLQLKNPDREVVGMDHVGIAVSKDKVAAFCQDHHIRKLALFGSVLREDFRPESDVDVLVEFEPGHVPGLIRLVSMGFELEELLGGRKVDLRTPEDLSRYFRDEVVATAMVLYG